MSGKSHLPGPLGLLEERGVLQKREVMRLRIFVPGNTENAEYTPLAGSEGFECSAWPATMSRQLADWCLDCVAHPDAHAVAASVAGCRGSEEELRLVFRRARARAFVGAQADYVAVYSQLGPLEASELDALASMGFETQHANLLARYALVHHQIAQGIPAYAVHRRVPWQSAETLADLVQYVISERLASRDEFLSVATAILSSTWVREERTSIDRMFARCAATFAGQFSWPRNLDDFPGFRSASDAGPSETSAERKWLWDLRDSEPPPEELDFGVESLRGVDAWLGRLRERGISRDEARAVSRLAGSYLGEVIRRNVYDRGHWIAESDRLDEALTLGVMRGRQVQNTPLDKVARLLAHGSENSLHFFATSLARL